VRPRLDREDWRGRGPIWYNKRDGRYGFPRFQALPKEHPIERFVCIHGHFYQPPRENPWIETVEIQDSAHPYHDWNERITAECYATNAAARILDPAEKIRGIVSNYAKISFNMGPSLLAWMQRSAPDVYAAVVEADGIGRAEHGGHGTAMAQAYNHMIMPLANARDKTTQVLWGIRDFEHRFGHSPEGMWLPETAVDLESLDIIANAGIRFTVLSPYQAKAVREARKREWVDVSGGAIDPTRPYRVALPSGKSIAVFFYDAPVSQAVAFERLLDSGEQFVERLLNGFNAVRTWPQIMHIATDGESYGHHHRFGEMALAYALDHIESRELARLTNYGEYLSLHPPAAEAQIFERTSWSCVHGVERWMGNCGCSSGTHPGWNQAWRAPLREALDLLRDRLAHEYEKAASRLFADPWGARDAYIDVVLDRSAESVEQFLATHARHPLKKDERVTALRLLEMQRQTMLMYTSCGWFFDDISGIETVQIMQYAGRAIQLAKTLFRTGVEREFRDKLSRAKSNLADQGDGARIYDRYVLPRRVTLKNVAAHYAISSLFNSYPEQADVYAYRITSNDYAKQNGGKPELITGSCTIESVVTGESETLSYGVLHLGGHDFTSGVKRCGTGDAHDKMVRELWKTFRGGAFADVIRLMDHHFRLHRYTLKDLFKDEQRNIIDTLLEETRGGFEAAYRKIYVDNRFLMAFLIDNGYPVPKAFTTASEFALNVDIKRLVTGEPSVEEVRVILDEFQRWGATLDAGELEFASRKRLEREMAALLENPSDIETLMNVERHLDIALMLPLKENLWTMQNIYFKVARSVYPGIAARADDDPSAAKWTAAFRSIGAKLHFSLDAILGDKTRQP
jgi:alpha-amylase/alpha-mannosidase (GH57 family)